MEIRYSKSLLVPNKVSCFSVYVYSCHVLFLLSVVVILQSVDGEYCVMVCIVNLSDTTVASF